MDYRTMVSSSIEFKENRDCSVKAIAIATNTEYSTVHHLFKLHGRRKGCGTYRHQQEAVLDALGFEMKRIVNIKSSTVLRLADEMRNVPGNFIVYTRGHMFAVKDGKVEDWTSGRRHRVLTVHVVIPKGTDASTTIQAPVVAPTPIKKQTNVTALIHKVAFQMWQEVGSPTEIKQLLKLRRSIMDRMVTHMGVNRNTASTELGKWQKILLEGLK